MGIVYEAFQESLGRHVAVKVLPGQTLLDPLHLRRFQREAQTAARLHHTNIVPVFGVGEHGGFHYIVMQLIDGAGLDDVLAKLRRANGRIPATAGKDAPKIAGLDAASPSRSGDGSDVARLARALAEGRFGQSHEFESASSDGSDDLGQTREELAPAGQPSSPAAVTEEFEFQHDTKVNGNPRQRTRTQRPARRRTSRGRSVRLIGGALPGSASNWPTHFITPIAIIRCTATSNRPMCCWTRRAWPGSPISGWPRRWSRTM